MCPELHGSLHREHAPILCVVSCSSCICEGAGEEALVYLLHTTVYRARRTLPSCIEQKSLSMVLAMLVVYLEEGINPHVSALSNAQWTWCSSISLVVEQRICTQTFHI